MYIFLKKSIVILISFFLTLSIPKIGYDYAVIFLNNLRDVVLVSLFYKMNISESVFSLYEHPIWLAWSMLLIFSICIFFNYKSSDKLNLINFYAMISFLFLVYFALSIIFLTTGHQFFLKLMIYLYSIISVKYFYEFLKWKLVSKK
jgi:hypothetical protein